MALPGECGSGVMCEQEPAGGTGGAAGGAEAAAGAAAGGSMAAAAGGVGACTDGNAARAESYWAAWPMPNPATAGLPNPASYETSQRDVVTDSVTGLMWQRVPDTESSFDEASDQCANLSLGGFCDWRLPTRIELVSLVDFTRHDPALDSAVLESGTGEYWSASSLDDARWRVGVDGATRLQRESAAPRALSRCVRAQVKHAVPEPHYEITGPSPDDLVTDRATGLIWQRRQGTATFTFAEAQTHCQKLGADFRVPSMKELQTLLDESKPGALIDSEAFPDFPTTQNITFWTSSPSAGRAGRAWFVRGASTLEAAVDADLSAKFYVRCVR